MSIAIVYVRKQKHRYKDRSSGKNFCMASGEDEIMNETGPSGLTCQ